MIYRNVSKIDAATLELACEFIRQGTGGQVQRAEGFDVLDEGGYWRVPCFSLDGRASMPLPHGAVFPSEKKNSIGRSISSARNGLNLKVLEATDPAGSWVEQQVQDSTDNESTLF
jgi:hypothetical protein